MPKDLAIWSLAVASLSLLIAALSLIIAGAALGWNVYSWRKDRRPVVRVTLNFIRAGELRDQSVWTVVSESARPTAWEVAVTIAAGNAYPVFVDSAMVVAPLRLTDPVKIQRTLGLGEPPIVARFPLDQVKSHGIDVYKPFQGYVVLGAPHHAVLSRKLQVSPPGPLKVPLLPRRSTVDVMIMPGDFDEAYDQIDVPDGGSGGRADSHAY